MPQNFKWDPAGYVKAAYRYAGAGARVQRQLAPRPLVYMDHWALRNISSDPALRSRMLRILERGTLLFSFMNLLEIARNRGASVKNIISFLDGVGSHWALISLSSSAVGRRERAGELDPWRAEYMLDWLHAPGVGGKLSGLVRRTQEPWAMREVNFWEKQEAAEISAMIAIARQRVRTGNMALDRTSEIPDVLDPRGIFETVIQRLTRGSLNLVRNQIDDLFHMIVPVAHADVVFLDSKTKKLLEGMATRAKVFSKSEIEAAFQYLEAFP